MLAAGTWTTSSASAAPTCRRSRAMAVGPSCRLPASPYLIHPTRPLPPRGVRQPTIACRVAAVEVAANIEELYEEEEEEVHTIDVAALNKRLEARAKAFIELEERQIQTRPLVKIAIQQQLALGEAFKVVGALPEFGRFAPYVAPFMTWTDGHVWTYTGRIRPGKWQFKIVLRTPDGRYLWEEGPDRDLEVPSSAGADDTIELRITNLKLPAA